MASKGTKISEAEEKTALSGTEKFPISDGSGSAKAVTANTIKKFVGSGGGDGKVKDVQVDGQSVLNEQTGIANIAGMATKSSVDAIADRTTDLELLTSELKKEVREKLTPTTTNAYINLGGGVGTVVNINAKTASAAHDNYVISCDEGDIFIVSGYTGVGARLWAFCDKDYKIIEIEKAQTNVNGKHIIAPSSASYIIINGAKNVAFYGAKKGTPYNTLYTNEVGINAELVNILEKVGYVKIETKKNFYISTSGDKAIIESPVSTSSWEYSITGCEEGDCIIVSGSGGQTPRLWAFCDTNNNILLRAEQNVVEKELVLIAPKDAAKVVINNNKSGEVSYYNSVASGSTLLHKKILSIEDFCNYVSGNIVSTTECKDKFAYVGDTKGNGRLTLCVMRDNGEIIGYRGYNPEKTSTNAYKIIKIDADGIESAVEGIGQCECHSIWKDSRGSIFVSPNLLAKDNRLGVWKMGVNETSLRQVLKLYDANSDDPKVRRENNQDSVWTYAEDDEGNLYCGTYTQAGNNASIYKSTDGGETWVKKIDLTESFPHTEAKHVHCVCWRQWDKCLYAVNGEYNTIYCSRDRGETWEDLGIKLPDAKSTTLTPTSLGLITTSDSAWNCRFCMVLLPSKKVIETANYWSNVAFAVRVSDITGYVYAFTLVDYAVDSGNYPPVEAMASDTALQNWKSTASASIVTAWQKYHDSIVDRYPDDAIRPQHCGIFVSKDGGLHWEVFKRIKVESKANQGFLRVGEFVNGECITYPVKDIEDISNTQGYPLIIREGRRKYTSNGIDISGDVLARLNESTNIPLL